MKPKDTKVHPPLDRLRDFGEILDADPVPAQPKPAVGEADLPQPCLHLAEIRHAANKIVTLTREFHPSGGAAILAAANRILQLTD